MTLTHMQKTIVQTTFAQVPNADRLAARFYERLFQIDPSTAPLFTHNAAEQRTKLMQTIAVVVHGLDHLPSIVPAIQDLGRRHVAYGVLPSHWESVGNALLWALEDAFGAAFTLEVRDAWASAYGLIATTALEAVESAQ